MVERASDAIMCRLMRGAADYKRYPHTCGMSLTSCFAFAPNSCERLLDSHVLLTNTL
jgi:hypothetical protein